ncbi:uncharacterized protein BO97DRAFT_415753 [Aspergillus homomorphus CBS 101889]|uniref:Uncharacterized protein n=1 Tax=Aspergillus homomorphus (strain CBS 101889) TaxID=1450537 RepID=A0A395HTH3_ASPHC|nr:hypothetical protein BO97DRAFT_415753 [Aspergillus homomorphus CBS 101889]RAL10713.1 hypothetical protein BO97DRAFT_415753 [Aspergillus homomorphus CBS 101889]
MTVICNTRLASQHTLQNYILEKGATNVHQPIPALLTADPDFEKSKGPGRLKGKARKQAKEGNAPSVEPKEYMLKVEKILKPITPDLKKREEGEEQKESDAAAVAADEPSSSGSAANTAPSATPPHRQCGKAEEAILAGDYPARPLLVHGLYMKGVLDLVTEGVFAEDPDSWPTPLFKLCEIRRAAAQEEKAGGEGIQDFDTFLEILCSLIPILGETVENDCLRVPTPISAHSCRSLTGPRK